MHLTGSVVIVLLTAGNAFAQQSSAASERQSRTSQAVGKEIRVTAVDGSQEKGKLVLLSASEVVFRREGRDVSIALDKVQKVEKTSHSIRNGAVIGGIGGFLAGCFASWSEGLSPGERCWEHSYMSLFTAAGIAAGAGVGAVVKAARADENVLYQASSRPTSVRVSPLLSPWHGGVALSVFW